MLVDLVYMHVETLAGSPYPSTKWVLTDCTYDSDYRTKVAKLSVDARIAEVGRSVVF